MKTQTLTIEAIEFPIEVGELQLRYPNWNFELHRRARLIPSEMIIDIIKQFENCCEYDIQYDNDYDLEMLKYLNANLIVPQKIKFQWFMEDINYGGVVTGTLSPMYDMASNFTFTFKIPEFMIDDLNSIKQKHILENEIVQRDIEIRRQEREKLGLPLPSSNLHRMLQELKTGN
jgi:hypothetical protein